MKAVFVSNYYNHHQSAICEELSRRAEEFSFVATSEMRRERRELGYGTDTVPNYVFCTHKDKAQRVICEKKIRDADVVLSGSAPERMILPGIYRGKLNFRYTERLLRKPMGRLKQMQKQVQLRLQNPGRKPTYLLCSGAYVMSDFSKFGVFKKKAYRWGYFPETKKYAHIDVLMAEKKRSSILWVGRMIDLKHPEYALEIAKRLKTDGLAFDLTMIGCGEMEEWLRGQIEELQLTDCVRLTGSMKPEQVRQHMEKCGIFMATSDRQEGWGAVINESMNSGCAVVASHAMGSVPYLIENEKNGLIFPSGNTDMLYNKVKDLLEHPEKQAVLGARAYETITTLWNAETAAQRLIALSEHILAGEEHPDLFESGPCSRAEILNDNWM